MGDDPWKARDELLDLYVGHFLESEELNGSQLAMRDRMRNLFMRIVERLAPQFEERGRYDLAESLYERARAGLSNYTPFTAGRRRRCLPSQPPPSALDTASITRASRKFSTSG